VRDLTASEPVFSPVISSTCMDNTVLEPPDGVTALALLVAMSTSTPVISRLCMAVTILKRKRPINPSLFSEARAG